MAQACAHAVGQPVPRLPQLPPNKKRPGAQRSGMALREQPAPIGQVERRSPSAFADAKRHERLQQPSGSVGVSAQEVRERMRIRWARGERVYYPQFDGRTHCLSRPAAMNEIQQLLGFGGVHGPLFGFDAGVVHHGAPLRQVATNPLREFLRCIADRGSPRWFVGVANPRRLQDLCDFILKS